MDWTPIINDCSKSFDLWFKHAGIAIHKDFILRTWTLPMEEYRSNEESVGYPLRDLYNFFDENGIYISVFPYWSRMKFDTPPAGFSVSINGNSYLNRVKDRREAEEIAFGKAFELLEQKLTTNPPTQ